MRGQQPMDTSRIVDLETLAGRRGAAGDRALRVRELSGFVEQAIAFAAKNLPKPKTEADALASDIALPTSGAWVDGPAITLQKGVWMISAGLLIQTSAAGDVALRVYDGAAGVLAAQVSHPATAGHFTTISASGVITLAAGATLTLQAAPSITSASISMIAQTTIGGALDATRLSAVQIGA